MYYDLNVPVTPETEPHLPRILARYKALGYGAVAVNYTVHGKLPRAPCTYQRTDSPTVPHQYTRLTVVLSDPQQNYGLNSANEIVRSYDLLAVQPTTERCFQMACQSLDIDIISIDLTADSRIAFPVRHGLVREAARRGIMFEVCYGASIGDGAMRKRVLGGAMFLSRICRGRSMLVSCGTGDIAGIRAPHDVRNWAELVGVPADHSRRCTVDNAALVVKRAGERAGGGGARGAAIVAIPGEGDEGRTHFTRDYIDLAV